MKTIAKDEIFQNLNEFLKTRGIELKAGSYAQAVRTSCSLLTDAINLGQEGLERAKEQFDKQVEVMRQVVHEKTAPKSPPPPPNPPAPEPTAAAPPKSAPKPPSRKRRPAKKSKARARARARK